MRPAKAKPPLGGFFVARPERAFFISEAMFMRKEKKPLAENLKLATGVISLVTAIAKLALLVVHQFPF